MAIVYFSRLAESDLLNVGAYTLRAWGEAQTARYLDELESSCQQLADLPHRAAPATTSGRAFVAMSRESM